MSSVAAKLHVTGLVQGVGYRYYCYRKALSLGLTGWVKNNPDGSVTAFAEGDRGIIDVFINDVKVGPSSAVVKDIKVTWLKFSGTCKGFNVTF